MPSEVRLALSCARSAEQLSELTNEFVRDLNRQSALEARPDTVRPAPGDRPIDIAAIGGLIVAFVGSGAAQHLVDLIRAYWERDRTLSVTIKQPDGRTIEISGKDLKPRDVEPLVQALQRLEPPARG